MKYVKAAKPKAKVLKPTVPKDVLAVITEVFSGHEKLYDAVAQLWERSSKRIFKLPNPKRFCNHNMFVAMHKKEREAFDKGLVEAGTRSYKKHYRQSPSQNNCVRRGPRTVKY